MHHRVFTKILASILAIVLIFTSIPINHLVVVATENTEIVNEEPPNQNELPTIASGEAPPFKKTEPKEVPELRTESSKVMNNGDGTYTMQMNQAPVYRKNSGNWGEIQSDLKKQKAGKLFSSNFTEEIATENTLLDIQFSPRLNENKYAIFSYKGHVLAYTFREASGEAGTQKAKSTEAMYEENKIFYKDIIPGLTLRNIVFDESVKEDIILDQYNGTNIYHFFMETDLTAKIEEDGSIKFRDQQNEIIYTLPKPYMTDSNINPESAEPQRSEDVHYELKQEGKGYALRLVADESWLKDSERVYPVYIDPTTKVQADQDASVSSAYPNANYESDWDSGLGAHILKAGNYSSATGENFAYVKTPTPSLPYATIETAIFNIYNIHSYYPGTNTGIWLDRVNGPWDAKTINWVNKPNSSLFTSTSVHEGKWATFNVKNAVNDWIKGNAPNYGFKLHTNGNGQTFWKKFYSSEHGVADYRPHLNISYFYPSPSNLSAKTYSLGNETGYIDLQWDAVAGASYYNIWFFDGKEYKSINVGKNTKWSTKDKSVWPQVGTNLPVNPQPVYLASGGTTYNDRTNYAISVSAVFANGESPKANPIVPTIPNINMPPAPTGVAYSNQIGTNSGYVNLEWEPIDGATGYKVWIFNGLSYESFDVKDATSWTTQNKGIWPTAEEVKNGTLETLKLHQDSKGMELPVDPSPMYAKMGTKYANSKNYFFRLSAYNAHGETVFSNDTLITKMPLGAEFLGAEDYWTMIGVPNGTVNAATGNLMITANDISISGNGPGLGISRTYNSLSPTVGLFGKGWHSDAEMNIVPQGQDAKLTDEDGTIHLFKKQNDGTYKAPTGIYLDLSETDEQYKLETKDQTIYYFTKSTGKLLKIMDRYRNSRDYLFTSNQLTIKESFIDETKNVTSREIIISLHANGRVEKITDPLQRIISFKYNPENPDLLEQVIDSSGQVTQYEYNANTELIKLYEPTHTTEKPVVTIYEYLNYRLDKVTDAKKYVYSLDYDEAERQLLLTKPNNSQIQYKFNVAGNPVQQIDTDESGVLKLITSYVYVGNNLEEMRSPKDQSTLNPTEKYSYDDNGNVKTSSIDQDNLKFEYEYNEYNDLKKSVVIEGENPKEKETTISYDGYNPISEVDLSGNVSSFSKYNQFGDILESSTPIGASNNLLINNSFEEGITSWTILRKNDKGTLAIDTNASNGLYGEKTLKINVDYSSPNNELGYVAASQEITVEQEKTYILSGKVKTNLTKANAFFNIEFLDSQSNIISSVNNRNSTLAGDIGWSDRQLTFKTPNNTAKVRVFLYVEHKDSNASGEAWFDAIQLQKSDVSSSYNPIVNSSFERELTNWTGTGGAIDTSAFDGNKSLKLTRYATQEPGIYKQTINIGQNSTDEPFPITLTGLSKTSDIRMVDGVSKEDYSIAALVHYADGTSKDFMEGWGNNLEWNLAAITIPSTKPISKIDVSLQFKGNYAGTAWFDAIRLTKGSVVTKTNYDSNGYPNKMEDELGYTTTIEYDSVGNKKEETDAKGTKKFFNYYATDLLKDLLLSNGTSIQYGYDKNGNMKSKSITDKDGKSQIFGYEYDELDNLTNTTGPLNDVTTYEYDTNGNLTKTILPRGNAISWTYDGVDRMKSISYNNEEYFTFKYDPNGNEESVMYVKEARQKSRAFDSSNRITNLEDRGGHQQWNYLVKTDKLDNFIFSHGAFTQTNKYEYNQLDQNTLVTTGGYTYRFDYNERGNVQTFTSGNGAGTTFNYDDRGLVSNLSIGTADGTDILTEEYVYDANGNRKKIDYLNDDTFVSYDYDDQEQLIKETLRNGQVNEYAYDGFGNREKITVTKNGQTTSKSAIYNIANQLRHFGDEVIAYDSNGNRKSDEKYIYDWNDADQLVSVTNLGETIPFVSYQYDESGKRIRKNVNGVVTNYHYDGDSINVLYETDGQNNVVRSYTYSEGGQMLSMKKGTQIFFYHYNAHGDVIALTNQSSQIVATYKYDAWGNVLEAEELDQVKDNPYRYAGYRYDQETGLYYLIARYYHSVHGVFLSLDPDPGDSDDILTQNGYAYVSNNPIKYFDPDGMKQMYQGTGPGGGGIPSSVNRGSTGKLAFSGGKAGEKYLAKLVGGDPQIYYKTSRGGRYVDQLANGIAYESKVGYTTLTSRVRTQILKDAELIKKGQINGAEWHFFRSADTGKIGASKPLLNFLKQNGIKYKIH